jgi:guanylate kinase
LLEHADVHGHSYGTPRAWVTDQLDTKTDVVLEIDVQGALQVKTLFPQAILVFLAPPSVSELSRRLHERNTEDDASISLRLQNARQEMMRINLYDYLIVNDRLEQAIEHLCAVALAERCRPSRQDLHALLSEEMPL